MAGGGAERHALLGAGSRCHWFQDEAPLLPPYLHAATTDVTALEMRVYQILDVSSSSSSVSTAGRTLARDTLRRGSATGDTEKREGQ